MMASLFTDMSVSAFSLYHLPPVAGNLPPAPLCSVRPLLHHRGPAAGRRQPGCQDQGGQDAPPHGGIRGPRAHRGGAAEGKAAGEVPGAWKLRPISLLAVSPMAVHLCLVVPVGR